MKISVFAKPTLTIVLITGLLFSFAIIASAEVLFGVSAEMGKTDLTADYPSTATISKSPNILLLDGNLNLLGTHINLEYGTASIDKYAFSTTGLEIGWEFGLSILTVKAFGGYQQYNFKDDTKNNTYDSLAGGLGAESKLGKFTIYGTTLIPVVTHFSNGVTKDDDASLSYLNLGVAYAPLPLVDVFINYRSMKANSNVVDIASNSYSLGAKLSF